MKRRITLTMVGVVAGALLLATFGTAVVTWLGARSDTKRDLTRQAGQIATRLDEVQRPGVLAALAAVLRLQDVRVVCVGSGCRGASPTTRYPFFKRNAARYAPSCPVMPVINAFFFTVEAFPSSHR